MASALQLAMRARPPLRVSPHPLPQHIKKAIWLRENTTIPVDQHREAQLQLMERIGARYPIQGLGPRLDLLSHLASMAGCPNQFSEEEHTTGLSLIGEQSPTGLWPRKLDPERLPPSELDTRIAEVLATHKAERSSGHYRLPGKKHRASLLNQLRAEQKYGWWEPEQTVQQLERRYGDFCLLLYFGVAQNDTIRGCIDPLEVSTLSALLETTYMAGLDGVVAVLQELRSVWGPCDLVLFKEDWEAGFRCLMLKQEHQRYFIAAAETSSGEVVGFVPKRLLFGPSRCPPQFSRASEAFEYILVGLLLVITTHHVDDHIGFERRELAGSARRAVRRTAKLLQIPLSEKKALPPICGQCTGQPSLVVPVCQSCGRCHRCGIDNRQVQACDAEPAFGVRKGQVLGPTLELPDSADRHAGVVATIALTAERTKAYTEKLTLPIAMNLLHQGHASKLAGAMEWTDSEVTGRQLRAFLWPIREHEHAKRPGPLPGTLKAALFCLAEILSSFPERKVLSAAIVRRYCVLFTDARGRARSQQDDGWGHERLAGVLVCAAGVFYFSVSTRNPLVEVWLPSERNVRINEAEALASLIALGTFADQLRGTDVLLLIDSAAAHGVLIKGYGGNPWLTAIAGAFWQSVGRVDAAVWVSHVPSKANLADPPSRGDFEIAAQYEWKSLEAVVPPKGRWNALSPESAHKKRHTKQMKTQGK